MSTNIGSGVAKANYKSLEKQVALLKEFINDKTNILNQQFQVLSEHLHSGTFELSLDATLGEKLDAIKASIEAIDIQQSAPLDWKELIDAIKAISIVPDPEIDIAVSPISCPGLARVTEAGITPAWATSVSIYNEGSRSGHVVDCGGAIVPILPKMTVSWKDQGLLNPLRYDATGTTFLINYTLPSCLNYDVILLDDGFLVDESGDFILYFE